MRKYLMGLLAIVGATILSAFTNISDKKSTGLVFFIYYGSDDMGLGDISQWNTNALTSLPEFCDDTDAVVCFISSRRTSSEFINFIESNPCLTRIQLEASEPGLNVISTRD